MDGVKAVTDELYAALAGVDEPSVASFTREIRRAKRVFVMGAGRSGLMARAFAMRLMHMGFTAFVPGDATTPGIAPGDLLVVCSASGRTESLCAAAAKARGLGATIALVTAFPDSPLARTADIKIVIAAPTPKSDADNGARSVQPMGTLFEQALLLALDIAVARLMCDIGTDEKAMFARHANLE